MAGMWAHPAATAHSSTESLEVHVVSTLDDG
jgi:hypothetical protein